MNSLLTDGDNGEDFKLQPAFKKMLIHLVMRLTTLVMIQRIPPKSVSSVLFLAKRGMPTQPSKTTYSWSKLCCHMLLGPRPVGGLQVR
jgi:hypothetical protein